MSAVQNVVEVAQVKKARGRKPAAAKEPVVDVNAVPAVVAESGDDDNAKKARKPTLPAKFAKFIQFGFFFMKELNDSRLLNGQDPIVDEALFMDELRVFADVDSQKEFVQKYFDGAKENAKTIRKLIADKKKAEAKANKPVKERKPRAKKNVDGVVDDIPGATAMSNDKTKTKGKAKTKASDGDLVAELVGLANADSATKPKRKYNRKPKNISLPHDTNELEVDVVIVNGKQVLIDDQRRVFDFDSHLPLGLLLPDGNIAPL
jgi:hypothetical protein